MEGVEFDESTAYHFCKQIRRFEVMSQKVSRDEFPGP